MNQVLILLSLLSLPNAFADTDRFESRYCAESLTDLDQRYEREVIGAPDAGHALKRLFKLLNEAFDPLVGALGDLVKRQGPDQIRGLAHIVEDEYPTFGPVPYAVFRNPVLLDRRRHHTARKFFYWLLFPERHFVSDAGEALIENDPTLKLSFERYYAAMREKWAALEDREDYGPLFLEEWDRSHGREHLLRTFAQEGEYRILDGSENERLASFASPDARAFRQKMRSTAIGPRLRLNVAMPEILRDIAAAIEKHSFDRMEGRAAAFLISLSRSGDVPDPKFEDDSYFLELGSITAVGNYGEALARTLMTTAKILNYLISRHLTEASVRAYWASPRLIERETGRGYTAIRSEAWRERLPRTPRSTLQEGVISLVQLLTSVLGGEIPSIDDGYRAVELLLGGDVVTGLTVRHPMGVIGPAALAGFFHAEALAVQEGKLKMAPKLLASLRQLKGEEACRIDHLRDPGMSAQDRFRHAANGIGCPMAANQGLRKLSDIFLRVFKVVARD